jgi:hypothetical protein
MVRPPRSVDAAAFRYVVYVAVDLALQFGLLTLTFIARNLPPDKLLSSSQFHQTWPTGFH